MPFALRMRRRFEAKMSRKSMREWKRLVQYTAPRYIAQNSAKDCLIERITGAIGMKSIAAACLGLVLAACSMTAQDGTPIVREGLFPGDGSLVGTITELADPGSTYKQR